MTLLRVVLIAVVSSASTWVVVGGCDYPCKFVSRLQNFLYQSSCFFTVGKHLLEVASKNQVPLDIGGVIGFKYNAHNVTMCLYHRSMQQCGEDIQDFLALCQQQCQQHSGKDILLEVADGHNKIVNVRLLAPDNTLDLAYVVRADNVTVIYFVEGPFCTVEKHLHTLRPPMLLLQNPECVTTSRSLLPTSETQPTPSINSGKMMEFSSHTKSHFLYSTGRSQRQENIAAITLGILLFIVCLIASFVLFGALYLCYKNV